MRLDRALTAVTLVAIGCGSFGEAASENGPGDAGTDAGETPPVPAEEPIVGDASTGSASSACADRLKGDAGIVFCSDFDDVGAEWAGWDRPDVPARYVIDGNERRSSPNAARMRIEGTIGSSPDARLRTVISTGRHFVITAAFRLESGSPATDAVLMKLQFTEGSLFVRSTGRVVETKPREGGSDFADRLGPATVPLRQWLDMRFEVDLPSGNFILTIGGQSRSATMEKKRGAGDKFMLIAGPTDPSSAKVAPDLTAWIDDVLVQAQP